MMSIFAAGILLGAAYAVTGNLWLPIALHFGWTAANFQHGWLMLLFYAVLIALGWLSYARFERPLQSLIRGGSRRSVLAGS